MKKLSLLLLLFNIACKSFAQYNVSGLIIDRADKKPIAYATVLLNNTSWAMASTGNGSFNLMNVRPGHYDLIVSCIGYEQYKTNIVIDDDISLPAIELNASSENLQQVQIKAKFKISSYFGEFRRAFLGSTDFAKQCKIVNPEVLHFDYDYSTHTLLVTSKAFLKVENNALGYVVKYILNNFTKNDDQGTLYYEGPSYFEEMKGTPEQQQLWQKNRMLTYHGSVMEFLRSLADDKAYRAGFIVNLVVRQPNPSYDPKKDGTANKFLEQDIKKVLLREQFMVRTNQRGLFAITGSADTCLRVCYLKTKGQVISAVVDTMSIQRKRKSACTVIVFNSRYAFFDYNGVIVNPVSISYEGYFGERRVGNQLPDDFQPN